MHLLSRLCCAAVGLAFLAPVARAGQTLRVYHVGNSVTNTIGYEGVEQLAAADGHTHVYGRHMSPGIRLKMAWNNETYNQRFTRPTVSVVRERPEELRVGRRHAPTL
jgi:hypothetical protein